MLSVENKRRNSTQSLKWSESWHFVWALIAFYLRVAMRFGIPGRWQGKVVLIPTFASKEKAHAPRTNGAPESGTETAVAFVSRKKCDELLQSTCWCFVYSYTDQWSWCDSVGHQQTHSHKYAYREHSHRLDTWQSLQPFGILWGQTVNAYVALDLCQLWAYPFGFQVRWDKTWCRRDLVQHDAKRWRRRTGFEIPEALREKRFSLFQQARRNKSERNHLKRGRGARFLGVWTIYPAKPSFCGHWKRRQPDVRFPAWKSVPWRRFQIPTTTERLPPHRHYEWRVILNFIISKFL